MAFFVEVNRKDGAELEVLKPDNNFLNIKQLIKE